MAARKTTTLCFLIALSAGVAVVPRAWATGSDVPVDVELVIAVDASRSMERFEQEIQRHGYVAAFRHQEIAKAILEGVHGKVAVVYVEWAGAGLQRVIVPWTLVDSRDAAAAFADELDQPVPSTQSRTSLSGAIDFSTALFDGNGFAGMRRVIDVSGDGSNNQGRPVTQARDETVAKGITINGLPLMTRGTRLLEWNDDQLDVYYSNCVIGGPGAFMIPVNDWAQFTEAVRRKLVLELAGRQPDVIHADWRSADPGAPVVHVQAQQSYDCLSGEKQWQRRMQEWEWR
ncbi:MAG: DUF1194 domain-containing protein [Phyllobacterium sp.]